MANELTWYDALLPYGVRMGPAARRIWTPEGFSTSSASSACKEFPLCACACARETGESFPAAPFNLTTPGGIAALNAEVTRQAAMVAYIDDFKLMMLIALASVPLLLLLREERRRPPLVAVAATAAADD